jgi:hypothetical protein
MMLVSPEISVPLRAVIGTAVDYQDILAVIGLQPEHCSA